MSTPWNFEQVERTASTNEDLLLRWRSGDLHQPTSRLAIEQTHGKGRRGRIWHSEPNHTLTFSLAYPFHPNLSMQFFQGLSLACGLGIIQGIAAYHNLPPTLLAKSGLGLKWPNDLYINDKKLGGILIEGGQKIIGEPFWMIIGIGLNLKSLSSSSSSSQIEYPIASLTDLPGLGQSQLIPIWHQLTQSLSDILTRYMNSGFEQFIPDWNQWHLLQDQLVEIQDENTAILTGKCRGINDYGAIIIETTSGIKTIHNGTLSLKKCP